MQSKKGLGLWMDVAHDHMFRV